MFPIIVLLRDMGDAQNRSESAYFARAAWPWSGAGQRPDCWKSGLTSSTVDVAFCPAGSSRRRPTPWYRSRLSSRRALCRDAGTYALVLTPARSDQLTDQHGSGLRPVASSCRRDERQSPAARSSRQILQEDLGGVSTFQLPIFQATPANACDGLLCSPGARRGGDSGKD
jgi:hypothetical protein